jgi:hypothetical protein
MSFKPISRKGFLFFTLKLFAITSASISIINCKQTEIPPVFLKSLTIEEYFNIRSIQEIFLKNLPFEFFDLGLALDDHIAGHANIIPNAEMLRELAGLPSSYLASLILDHSLTPLALLNIEEREKRLLSWRHSTNSVKRGAFLMFQQISFFLLSKEKVYQQFTGYK